MNKRYRHLCVSNGVSTVAQPPLNKYDSVMKITNFEVCFLQQFVFASVNVVYLKLCFFYYNNKYKKFICKCPFQLAMKWPILIPLKNLSTANFIIF